MFNEKDPLAFVNNPFWTSASLYISDGPYRATDWVRGSTVTFHAFDGYFLGRPKIDEVVFQVASDPNTLVAYLLAGTVDVSLSLALNQAGWAVIKPEWERTGGGTIYSIPKHLLATQFQLESSRMSEPTISDGRVREAMVRSLDRTVIANAVSQNASPAADFMMSPYDRIDLPNSLIQYYSNTVCTTAERKYSGGESWLLVRSGIRAASHHRHHHLGCGAAGQLDRRRPQSAHRRDSRHSDVIQPGQRCGAQRVGGTRLSSTDDQRHLEYSRLVLAVG